jgi:outer membrane protein assembly factor BamB
MNYVTAGFGRLRNRSVLVFAGCVLATLAPFAPAADWPQWQGPDRNAVSKETGLLKEWPKGGPPLAWKVKGLGGGDGAPSVAAGRIFGMGNRDGDEAVWALSETDGKTVWTQRLGPAVRQKMPQGREGPGCTPTVDGDRLYVLGMGGDLACLRVADGKILWQRRLTRDFGGQVPTWSYRESPLVDGDKLICTPGGKDATLVALNKMTGETIWKSKLPDTPDTPDTPGAAGAGGNPRRDPGRPGGPGGPGGRRGFGGGRGGFGGPGSGAAYASAIAVDFDGQREYVQLTAKALVGVAASDGKFLWRYDRAANGAGINCSTPLYHDGLVFAASAYGAGGALLKLTRDAGGAVKAEEVYFTRKMQNHHGGMIVHDGSLYGANGGNEGGFLVCIDFPTGKVLWDQRSADDPRALKGSVALAGGRLYYRNENGPMLLIEPNAREYSERGSFDQPDRSDRPAWSHPVIANGKLYLRDQDVLLCYDVKAK